MVICFETDAKTKKALDRLLALGKYSDYGEAISIAVSNQLTLHEQLKNSRSVVVGESISVQLEGQDQTNLATTSLTIGPYSVPELFMLKNGGDASYDFGVAEEDRRSSAPVDEWIFGQFNRLLPLKVALRGLHNLLLRHGGKLELSMASELIACEASKLWNFLMMVERGRIRDRDDLLTTAFPQPGPETDKGRLRFANHFVGSVSKSGFVTGLPFDMKMVAVTNGGQVALTEAGWRFATLSNPVLDGMAANSTGAFPKLSLPERHYLAEHVSRNVPAERSAYSLLLSAIASGMNTPEKVLDVLRDHVGATRIVSEPFLATQRTGAISRMIDLGLVVRERLGVRATYHATDFGRTFLQMNRTAA